MDKNVRKCVYYVTSRQEKKDKRLQGMRLEGIAGYKERGCYQCKGDDILCTDYIYFSLKKYRGSYPD